MAERAVLCGKGGCAGPDFCEKHKVPLIHTITEETICAVCERAALARLMRKASHGCIDMNCDVCD